MSTYSEGQVHQLVDRLESEGFTAEHITKLGQCTGLADIRAFLEGKAEIVMKKMEKVVMVLLSFVKTITTPTIAGKKTSECFTNKSRYYYRDGNLDVWLPKNQPNQSESKFSVQQLAQSATFRQAVENFLGQSGDIVVLARLLKELGYITTLPTIESLIERQEAGEDVGLWTNGYANFFFVEEKAENEGEEPSVSVVGARRHDGQWLVHVDRLDVASEWNTEDRFFFRNSDTVSL
ncbi:MAG: hypothetical protein A3A96_03375 [Candidatus Zambryskibacteria bacterium RIFCSPLOWO2_01_FULL_39_39]|uniref:Uncharacterized protein n=1 Tax=Candidatus Zambryskibacteria bacterium RIFCSPLOWO2_01_FULL_39_39 TaxID=1802758 RepID=A0A1G2TWS2_9BACT|nr:MAG: hypothetical protein A3A96_03375 [Candidatus Zambryskibacteria bacterium RIFCSPLOWO2_01_FULL_39_39]